MNCREVFEEAQSSADSRDWTIVRHRLLACFELDPDFSPALLLWRAVKLCANGVFREGDLSDDDALSRAVSAKSSPERTEAARSFCDRSLRSHPESGTRLFISGYFADHILSDIATAIAHYRRAADMGCILALNAIGVCNRMGLGMEPNAAEAARIFLAAAEQGHVASQHSIGICCELGLGIPQSRPEAARWYKLSASQGFAPAQNNLAACFCNGWGVGRDYAAGLHWMRKAASQCHPEALNNLGVMYHNGLGVRTDIVKAIKWFERAAAQGHPNARERIRQCFQLEPHNVDNKIQLDFT